MVDIFNVKGCGNFFALTCLWEKKCVSLSAGNRLKDWKNIGAILAPDEWNVDHFESYQDWLELESRLSKGEK